MRSSRENSKKERLAFNNLIVYILNYDRFKSEIISYSDEDSLVEEGILLSASREESQRNVKR